jgi:PAS domain S-box-containing protein
VRPQTNLPPSNLGVFLDSIVENLPNMIFVKDADELRFVLFNRAGEELIGHPRREMIGKNDYDLFPSEEADFFTRKDREVLAGGELVEISEEPIHTKEKGTRTLHTKKIPILDDNGEPRFLLGISEDITEKKEGERRMRQAERLASIGTLAAGIAHEINNPIGAILLHAQAATRLDSSQQDELQHILHQIIEQSMRCGNIVRSVLRFAKQGPSEKWLTDINASVQKAARIVERNAKEHGSAITLALGEALPEVRINPTEVEQIVINLLLNSIQSADTGISATVTTQTVGDCVRISVADTGPGIPADKRDYVFDPFYSGRQHEGGVGLGLSIVRGIVESHGGTVDAACGDQGGTTVVVDLPFAEF